MNFEKIKEMNKRDLFYLKEKIFLFGMFLFFYTGIILKIIIEMLDNNQNLKLLFSKLHFLNNILLAIIIFCIGCGLSYITKVIARKFYQKFKTFERYESQILKSKNIIVPVYYLLTRIVLILISIFFFIYCIRIAFFTYSDIVFYNYISLTSIISLPLILLCLIVSFSGDVFLLLKEKRSIL